MEETALYKMLKKLLGKQGKSFNVTLDKLYAIAKTTRYQAKEVFVYKGQQNSKIALLVDGYAIGYQKLWGKNKLSSIWKPGDVLLDMQNILINQPSDLQIIFPGGASLLEIHKKDLKILDATCPQFKSFVIFFLVEQLGRIQKYSTHLHGNSISDRFGYFMNNYKSLDDVLTIEEKASFLNMSIRWYQENKKKYLKELYGCQE